MHLIEFNHNNINIIQQNTIKLIYQAITTHRICHAKYRDTNDGIQHCFGTKQS